MMFENEVMLKQTMVAIEQMMFKMSEHELHTLLYTIHKTMNLLEEFPEFVGERQVEIYDMQTTEIQLGNDDFSVLNMED